MCGIAGIYSPNTSVDQALQQMLKAMHHRGPDYTGTWHDGPMWLGHNRLSIIDLSDAGRQPMTSACGRYTIILNGEVYNFQQLREQLGNITLRSTSDTEIVLELWAQKQEACLPELRGMFVFAVWDHELKTLTLARDHMGIKPVYYYFHDGNLVFASEIKGMLASGMVPRALNPNAVSDFLNQGYVLQPETFIKNVYMLPPASFLVFKGKPAQPQTYWHITNASELPANTEEEAINTIRQLLTAAVQEETFSDRPLGIFLSGGLDSTVMIAALRNAGVSSIKTFSVGFDGDELSEEDDAKETAAFYQTQHTQLQVTDNDVLQHLDEYIHAIDQPSVDGLNTWLVSKITSQHVTVALSGLGGDELFSGYSIDRKTLHRQRYRTLAQLLQVTRPLWKPLLPASQATRFSSISEWASLPQAYAQWGRLFETKQASALFPSYNKTLVWQHFKQYDAGAAYSPLNRLSHLHMRTFMMSRLLRDSDAVSMDHSIEVRFPLIDYRLVNYLWKLPQHWKIKDIKQAAQLTNYEKENSYEINGVKHLLYQAFKKDLPPSFGKRPKRGFRMPIEKWLKGELNQRVKNTLLAEQTCLAPAALKQLVQQWENGQANWSQVWALYILESWIKQHQIHE